MPPRIAILLSFALPLAASAQFVTVDRIAIIVGGHAIKTSDIDRDMRATEFLNDQPLDLGPDAKKQAAQRLIDQQLIRHELNAGGYQRPSESEAAADLSQIRNDRFGGSAQRFEQALQHYGLTEDELRVRLLWQLTVLSFIDQRFRPGVLISDQDLHNYYDQHRAELERQYGNKDFTALEPKIRQTVAEQQINQQFFAWLDERRKDTKVQFIPGVLE